MRNPLSKALGTNRTLGLQVSPGFVGAVLVHQTIRGPEIEKAAFYEPEGEGDAGGTLRSFIEAQGMQAPTVVTSLPTSNASLRELDVALKSGKKIRRVIKYQVEPYVPFPVEDAVVDYLPGRANGRLLAAVVEKKRVAEHLDTLGHAGLDPACVTLDDLAVNTLHRRLEGKGAARPVALLRLGPDRDGVQIVQGARIRLMRSLPRGEEGVRALVEALRLDAIENPEAPVEKILLTGPGGIEPSAAGELEKRLGVPVEPWRPFSLIKSDGNGFDEALQARLSVPLGLAMAASDRGGEPFNLRKEEFRKKRSTDIGNQVWAATLGLLLLAGLTGFHLHWDASVLERGYNALRWEMDMVLRSTFPDTSQVIPGREFFQMQQKVREQQGRFGWLTALTSNRTVLDRLTVLTGALSTHTDVLVDNFSVDGGEIHLDGRAASFQTVDRIKAGLEKERTFRSVKLLSAKSDKGKGSVRFSFVLEGNE